MLITVVLVGLATAVAVRRLDAVRRRLPPPASTLLVTLAASASAMGLAPLAPSLVRVLLGAALTIVASALLVGLACVVVDRIVAPLRRRRAARAPSSSIRSRVVARADASTVRLRGVNPVALTVRSALRAGDVRVTGLAAEMSYYALISLVPIATALGSSLGFLRPLLGDEQVEQIRTSIVDALTTIFAQQVASDVLAPLVDGLLSEERTGFAVGAVVITLYLASRVFRAAVRALDDAYRAGTRRNVVAQYLLGLLFTIGSLVVIVTVTLLVVVGPLLGNGSALAASLGLGEVFQVAWDWLRWPVAFAVGLAFLVLLYRYAPNITTTWRRCLPGAVFGSLGLLLVSSGFMLYVRLAAPSTLVDDAGNAAVVRAAAQMLSLVLAGVLWLWLGAIVVLLGGILNAELDDELTTPALAVDEAEADDAAATVGPRAEPPPRSPTPPAP